MKITATNSEGVETDVTEAVQVVYDAMHSYMTMASGSLDKEEWDAVLHLSNAAEFPDYANLVALREYEERRAREREERRVRQAEMDAKRRQDDYQKLRQQIAIVDKMRAEEPELAAQGFTFHELITLHAMRENGTA